MFGENCSESCGNCLDGEQCHHVNGTCDNGCAAGWQGEMCRTGKQIKCVDDDINQVSSMLLRTTKLGSGLY